MSYRTGSTRHELPPGLAKFEALRGFRGEPREFWRKFLDLLGPIVRAEALTALEADGAAWREIACWPESGGFFADLLTEEHELAHLARESEPSGSAISTYTTDSGATHPIVAVRWALGEEERGGSALTVCLLRDDASAAEAVTCLHLAGAEPLLFQRSQRPLPGPRSEASTLSILARLHAERRFLPAARTLCEAVSQAHRTARASLGWRRGRELHLCATSEAPAPDRTGEIPALLEAVMDEAAADPGELLWPPPEGATAVCRAHGSFARRQGVDAVLSIPLRMADGKPQGILTLERAGGSFSAREVGELRGLADALTPRLAELHRRSRWFGARLAAGLRENTGGHPWLVRAGWGLAGLAALWLLFGTAEYRVEAPFILRSATVAQLPAPFDGYIEEVFVRPGDPVTAGQPLAALDSRELLLKEAAALAERQRLLAEAQKREGEGDAAEMRIAQAGAEEARARLELVRYQLSQVRITAGFDGYVVEGDLRDRIAAPVRQGEVLFRVAALTPLFIEAAVPERDIHEVRGDQPGKIAFLGRPHPAFPIRTARVEPVAQVRRNGNVFLVRGELATEPAPWWRPGMSGVCSISVGRRRLVWIAGHRVVDFVRLSLWR